MENNGKQKTARRYSTCIIIALYLYSYLVSDVTVLATVHISFCYMVTVDDDLGEEESGEGEGTGEEEVEDEFASDEERTHNNTHTLPPDKRMKWERYTLIEVDHILLSKLCTHASHPKQ